MYPILANRRPTGSVTAVAVLDESARRRHGAGSAEPPRNLLALPFAPALTASVHTTPQVPPIDPRSGTLMSVYHAPARWPIPQRAVLARFGDDRAFIEFVGHPDGSVAYTVFKDGLVRTFRSPPLELTGPGAIIVQANWSEDSTDLHLNFQPIPRAGAGASPVRLNPSPRSEPSAPAWQDRSATQACAEWMSWRAAYFSAEKLVRAGRRPKTLDEQVAELQLAEANLADLTRLLREGRVHLRGHLAAELRALLHWDSRRLTHLSNADPLLLRLAARAGVPLPLYAFMQDPPDTLGVSLIHFRMDTASCSRAYPRQTLVDLQEWLLRPAMSETQAGVKRDVSALDVIRSIADTQGAAHYDTDMPLDIERLGLLQLGAHDTASEVLLTTAEIAGQLSGFVRAQHRHLAQGS